MSSVDFLEDRVLTVVVEAEAEAEAEEDVEYDCWAMTVFLR